MTDRIQAAAGRHALATVVGEALVAGAGGVLLREKDLPAGERRHLAGELRALTAAHAAELWVASDVGLAEAVGADGVHLAADDPWPTLTRLGTTASSGYRRGCCTTTSAHRAASLGLVARPIRVGRSCHTVAELEVARRQGADRVTYSPVFATESKPGYGPALGLDGLAAGCRAVPGLAVLALGGITPRRARACVDAGATGVAVMGAVMRAGDPAGVVRALVDEVTEVGA